MEHPSIWQVTWTDKKGYHRRAYVNEDYARQHARRLLAGTRGVVESTIQVRRYDLVLTDIPFSG